VKYNKLVRDKIIDIVRADGKVPSYRVADDDEYETYLQEKLVEESNEFFQNPSSIEMADIFEVLDAMIEYYGLDRYIVETDQESKRWGRGGFTKKIILEEVKES
tara:strand:- start:502 stop:813 length:312 start_codon:yes stop_codon:yes gene_type:complete